MCVCLCVCLCVAVVIACRRCSAYSPRFVFFPLLFRPTAVLPLFFLSLDSSPSTPAELEYATTSRFAGLAHVAVLISLRAPFFSRGVAALWEGGKEVGGTRGPHTHTDRRHRVCRSQRAWACVRSLHLCERCFTQWCVACSSTNPPMSERASFPCSSPRRAIESWPPCCLFVHILREVCAW